MPLCTRPPRSICAPRRARAWCGCLLLPLPYPPSLPLPLFSLHPSSLTLPLFSFTLPPSPSLYSPFTLPRSPFLPPSLALYSSPSLSPSVTSSPPEHRLRCLVSHPSYHYVTRGGLEDCGKGNAGCGGGPPVVLPVAEIHLSVDTISNTIPPMVVYLHRPISFKVSGTELEPADRALFSPSEDDACSGSAVVCPF